MLTRNSSAHERELAFQHAHGNPDDTAQHLPVVVIALLRSLGIILGDGTLRPMAKVLLQRMGATVGEDWEEDLRDQSSGAFSEWKIGEAIHRLEAYTFFGVDYCGPQGRGIEEIAKANEPRLRLVEKLGHFLPLLDLWPDLSVEAERAASEYRRLFAAAQTRVAIDTGARVPVDGLPVLAGISESRMRNIAKRSADAILPVDDDRTVAHDRAKAWLEDQERFLQTVTSDHGHEAELSEIRDPVFVPVAADGTRFEGSLRRDRGFQIGPKGDETWVADFDEALERLTHMPVPCWRRPSDGSGRMGIVRATHWERVPRETVAPWRDL